MKPGSGWLREVMRMYEGADQIYWSAILIYKTPNMTMERENFRYILQNCARR